MSCGDLVEGPFGLGAARGQTCLSQRMVLVVVHTVASGTRLADIWPLLESDRRVQLVFTRPPGALVAGGVNEFLARLGGLVAPWHQVTQVRFDLAIAASYGQLERLHAPVVKVSHGIGFSKYAVRYDGFGAEAPLETAGLERAELIYRGRVIPSSIVVPTSRDLERVRRAFPEAASAAVVAGDPCYDRLAASLPLRAAYRQALGVGARKLIAVSSTWGSGSLLQRCPDLLPQLVEELPPEEYQVTAIVHPNAWYWHGPRQVRAWYGEALRRGLVLVPPEEGWRAVLAAADWVIGDHGSVTCYAASLGVPVLLAAFPEEDIEPGSLVADLGKIAPRLDVDQPIGPQLSRAVTAWSPDSLAAIRARVTDVPGQSARIIRRLMYRLMKLPEPVTRPDIDPVPRPAVITGLSGAVG